MVKKIRGYTPLSSSSTLISLLWLGADAIIKTRDPMQNPNQTQIFYKSGQTRLTQTKRDAVDPDDLTWLQPWQLELQALIIVQTINPGISTWQNVASVAIYLTLQALIIVISQVSMLQNQGGHSNILCTLIFILSQDESQGTTTKKGWSKVKLYFSWIKVNLAFYKEYGYCTS